MLTLADYTRPLRPHISLSVVSQEAFERILALTSHFPAALANNVFGLEVHLAADRPFVDVFLYFREGQLSFLPEAVFDPLWRASYPAWHKVFRAFTAWCDPRSPLHNQTEHAWICFDLEQPLPEVPVPGLFYCSVSKKMDYLLTLQALADLFVDPDEFALATNNLARCLRHIPGHAVLSQVGFGLLRKCGTIRLQMIRFSPRDVPAYLQAVGWDYPTAPLQPILDLFSDCDMLTVMIDVSSGIHPKIGIEGVLKGYDARWKIVLDGLVEQGLCQPEKRDFLAQYPAPKLCQLEGQMSLTRQRLSHVKVGYHPENVSEPFEAKAYPAYYPEWLSEKLFSSQSPDYQGNSHLSL